MPESPLYYYVCSHQAANDPCSECNFGQSTMSDNWYETYILEESGGILDSTNLNSEDEE